MADAGERTGGRLLPEGVTPVCSAVFIEYLDPLALLFFVTMSARSSTDGTGREGTARSAIVQHYPGIEHVSVYTCENEEKYRRE